MASRLKLLGIATMVLMGASGCGCVVAPPSHFGYARYDIGVGAHWASIDQNGAPTLPVAGISTIGSRNFEFIFDASAEYALTNPVQPEDQFDWNKLPGFSDCGDLDLAVNGAMFGWRWRLDTNPHVLEITAYANNSRVHLWPNEPLLALTHEELVTETPLNYSVAISPDLSSYQFSVSGMIGGRQIDVSDTLPRHCVGASISLTKWAAGMYFGGTSTAPSPIRGWILER